jgi:molybdopterin converting factor small subunit
MSVKVKIFHGELQQAINSPGEIRVEGATVGECLADLVRRYPQAERFMFDSRGRLLRQFYVYVNQEGMFKADFARPVTDEDTLLLVVLASGG